MWRTRAELVGHAVPAEMVPWLYDQGSLTKRIQGACNKKFRVEVLSQSWQRPMLNEALRMGAHAESHALIREVLLYCGDTPWVFARTVIPRKSLTGPRRFLGKLGTKPLGAVLFADPHTKRDELEIANIKQGQRMYECATRNMEIKPAEIWGRRSVFYLQKKPLLVNEIFLPAIRDKA